MADPHDFERALAALDTRLFDRIESQSTEGDRRSLLACQLGIRSRWPAYVYLEIGSHLGGSLQTHLVDPCCVQLYSIDKRPPSQPDARGVRFDYAGNSTARMLDALRRLSEPALAKLTCLDGDAGDIRPDAVARRPQLCFIDGEHTDDAVQRDFAFCRAVLAPDGAIVFHDATIVYHGLAAIVQRLQREGQRFHAYHLADSVFVIEFDGSTLHQTPAIAAMLLDNHVGYLASLAANDHYRAFANRPLFRWLRSLKIKLSRAAAAR